MKAAPAPIQFKSPARFINNWARFSRGQDFDVDRPFNEGFVSSSERRQELEDCLRASYANWRTGYTRIGHRFDMCEALNPVRDWTQELADHILGEVLMEEDGSICNSDATCRVCLIASCSLGDGSNLYEAFPNECYNPLRHEIVQVSLHGSRSSVGRLGDLITSMHETGIGISTLTTLRALQRSGYFTLYRDGSIGDVANERLSQSRFLQVLDDNRDKLEQALRVIDAAWVS